MPAPIKAISIDIETLATTDDAVIVQISWLVFDPLGSECDPHKISYIIDVQSQPERAIDPSTVRWWLTKVSKPVVRDVLGHDVAPGVESLAQVLRVLAGFIKVHSITRFYCQGTDFDKRILTHAYKELGMDVPWNYYQWSDARTLKVLAEDLGIELPKKDDASAHDALYDAELQAKRVQALYTAIVNAQAVSPAGAEHVYSWMCDDDGKPLTPIIPAKEIWESTLFRSRLDMTGSHLMAYRALWESKKLKTHTESRDSKCDEPVTKLPPKHSYYW